MLYKHRNKAGRESRRIPYIYAATPSLCPVCALYAAVCEINKVDVMRSSGEGCLRGSEDGGMMVRPQGGGGIDPRAKVQQNKAQTDIPFSHSLFYSLFHVSTPSNRSQFPLKASDSSISGGFLCFSQTPGYLPPLKVT